MFQERQVGGIAGTGTIALTQQSALLTCVQAAEKDLPGLADDIEAGKFERLKGWLNEKIHKASKGVGQLERFERARAQAVWSVLCRQACCQPQPTHRTNP